MSGESFTPRPHRLGSHSVGESLMTMTAAQFDLKDSPYISVLGSVVFMYNWFPVQRHKHILG